ncbi:hypothetical protein EVAR_61342_1 [Eumeta japonica]|uniref:Uncharacterized protein n=1 Tax=Eumeta variegata TaxID=151549 RepID=A0A4C1Y4U4_EUMVA|nr:hypothetical protein EVAR_61342_1 [Eumeta japonica]
MFGAPLPTPAAYNFSVIIVSPTAFESFSTYFTLRNLTTSPVPASVFERRGQLLLAPAEEKTVRLVNHHTIAGRRLSTVEAASVVQVKFLFGAVGVLSTLGIDIPTGEANRESKWIFNCGKRVCLGTFLTSEVKQREGFA